MDTSNRFAHVRVNALRLRDRSVWLRTLSREVIEVSRGLQEECDERRRRAVAREDRLPGVGRES
ncbi:hypothetical protein [Streptomyces sp. BH055]|uniref:hypothetical protein n=1 Tax=Streptomyces sp. BH055 TaxID=3401173 RepID=UPI003BB6AC87